MARDPRQRDALPTSDRDQPVYDFNRCFCATRIADDRYPNKVRKQGKRPENHRVPATT